MVRVVVEAANDFSIELRDAEERRLTGYLHESANQNAWYLEFGAVEQASR